MWTGTGPRESRRSIRFSSTFTGAPLVSVGLSLWDMHHATNFRADISAENVREDGFDIVFKTWGDTRIARMRADWLAFGPVSYEDNWQVD